MIHELTIAQIAELRLDRHRPLVICDVDEVIVHFTSDFEDFLIAHGLWLDTTSSQQFHFSIRSKSDQQPISDAATGKIVSQFFAERTRYMKTIPGAVESLHEFARFADVVMLTNLPHEAGDHRRENLAGHGINFPVVTNSGPKGPAIKSIASQISAPVVFIDDSPSFITSAYEHAPHVHLIHFIHDERFARVVQPLEFVSLRTDNWAEIKPHVLKLIDLK